MGLDDICATVLERSDAMTAAQNRVTELQRRMVQWRNDYLAMLAQRDLIVRQIAQAEQAARGNIVQFKTEVAQ